MNRNLFALCIPILVVVFLAALWGKRPLPTNAAPSAVQAPILKWQNAGCYNSWCETGWYSSPAVADLDGDGKPEVIGATYTLFVLNGEDGSVQWKVDPPGSRVWPGVVLADLSDDGDLEIVVASGGGNVAVYNHQGNLEPGWPQNPASNEFRSLAVGDLDDNGDIEIVVGQAKLDKVNTWVFEHTGAIRSGWPQITNTEGSAAGLYNDNIGLGDLDGDGQLEVIVPSDTITIGAFKPNGSALPTNEMYHDHSGHDMDFWAEVPAYIDLAYETHGWGPCYTEFTARANFANGPANIVDVNGDGINEVVVIGDVHNCNTSPYTDLYNTPYILNLDRSRFNTDGFNWTTPPVNTGTPIIQNYNVIESVQPNPVTVDLDGDGNLEIIYPSYDGRLHAFWLDKTEHHNWPYNVSGTGPGIRFASEPVVADLDNDGQTEVIFTSWPQKGSDYVGKLHILSYQGSVLHEIPLPAAYGSPDWNGAMAAPTLANIDSDADLEIVINTAHSGFVAYDLPGTANARVLWGTGRGNYQRSGSYLYGSLDRSRLTAAPMLPAANDTVRYTIHLDNPGPELSTVTMTDTIPANVTYAGNLSASSGTPQYSGGTVTWSGSAAAGSVVTVSFDVTVNPSVTSPTPIVNTALINDGLGNVLERSVTVIANGEAVYLPMIMKE